MVDYVTGYRNQLESFWNRHYWPVKDIPDPKDTDPTRYAFLACVTELMVRSYNEKIKLGQERGMPAIISPEEAEYYRTRPESSKKYEQIPEWANNIAPLKETLSVRSHDDMEMTGFDDERASSSFKEKNILI